MTPERTPSGPALAVESLREMVSGLAVAAEAWTPSLDHHPTARTGRRILATGGYDVWLLRWPVGTAVSPHDHGDSDAAFAVAAGSLTEVRWSEGRREERILRPGAGATIRRGVVHDVVATTEEALSVHAYSPPLSRMAFFDERAEQVVLEEPVDRRADQVVVADGALAGRSAGVDQALERARARIAPRVHPSRLPAALEDGALLVDTRPTAIRARDGELDGALVIDRNVLEWRLDPWGPHRIPEASDPDRPVIVVCDEGYASSLAAASLLDLGRRNVTDLEGGFQAWREDLRSRCAPR